MNGYFMFPEYGRDIVTCLACMAICSLAYWLQQWLDKDVQYLKEAIKPSLMKNTLLQEYKVYKYKVFDFDFDGSCSEG